MRITQRQLRAMIVIEARRLTETPAGGAPRSKPLQERLRELADLIEDDEMIDDGFIGSVISDLELFKSGQYSDESGSTGAELPDDLKQYIYDLASGTENWDDKKVDALRDELTRRRPKRPKLISAIMDIAGDMSNLIYDMEDDEEAADDHERLGKKLDKKLGEFFG